MKIIHTCASRQYARLIRLSLKIITTHINQTHYSASTNLLCFKSSCAISHQANNSQSDLNIPTTQTNILENISLLKKFKMKTHKIKH